MKHQPDLPRLAADLFGWYKTDGRHHLPWRQTGLTAYHIWLSEIMLQQTQVSRVIPYFERMIERFPTVQDLAKATWEEFLPYYQGLGYYSRGRNMLLAAQTVVTDHAGEFPADFSALLKLPGIGPYTANAILSFAYNSPHLAFDTNHKRVWGRVLHGSKEAEVDQSTLLNALPTSQLNHLNAAVMDLASLVCTNRNPGCHQCPLKNQCLYFAESGRSEPVKTKQSHKFPTAQAQTVLILHQSHKRYFSSLPQEYVPFTLPQPVVSRAQIKAYFLRNYGLNLSVRPPHWLGTWQGNLTQLVNAQVLFGTNIFAEYDSAAQERWLQAQGSELQPWESKR